ncbi:hypothetical protein PAMP_008309 [Pampus punctatissimus]
MRDAKRKRNVNNTAASEGAGKLQSSRTKAARTFEPSLIFSSVSIICALILEPVRPVTEVLCSERHVCDK